MEFVRERTILLLPGFPEIVTLVGSSRFKDQHLEAMRQLTLEGRIVIPLGLYGHLEGLDMTGPVKVALDQLHFWKIDLCDRVHVINVDGYIGQSTTSEILYATRQGKVITYLEPR